MTAESLGWLAPAPVWGDAGVGVESPALLQPFLVELTSDQFMAEFLAVLGAQGGASPASLATMAPHQTSDDTASGPYRLYQPVSQCYYLVTALLVCRRVGIPDRAVRRSKGERTTFVVRRLCDDGSELAWTPATGPPAHLGDPPSGSWIAAPPGQLADGEEQLPMHAAPVAGFAVPGTTAAAFGMSEPGRRTVHYGYIATSRRERMVTALQADAAVDAVLAVDPSQKEGIILGDLVSRVIQPWAVLQDMQLPPPSPAVPPDTDYASLYVLLDLADWLSAHLPSVYNALLTGTTLPSGTTAENLRSSLNGIQVGTRLAPLPLEQPPPPGFPPAPTLPPLPTPLPLPQALQQLTSYAPLVTGGAIPAPLQTSYVLTHAATVPAPPLPWLADSGTGGSLANLALAALKDADVRPGLPGELDGMIKRDPATPVPGYAPDTYVIRTVFEHDPCVPVLSAPSRPFQLARVLDGDAPARKIRIALPDISNLRQFQRGVAIEMPPSLRRVVDRVNPKMLQGDGLGTDPGVELGMICSFSIQIMWVLSFMVMFLFAISFNIIFWWMAFIKICFPIPVPVTKKSGPPAP